MTLFDGFCAYCGQPLTMCECVKPVEDLPDISTARAHARCDDPETSHEAAATASRELTKKQQAVLDLLRQIGPSTDERIWGRYQGPPQSPSGLRTRRKELVRKGLVEFAGEWDVNRNGNRTRIWRAI